MNFEKPPKPATDYLSQSPASESPSTAKDNTVSLYDQRIALLDAPRKCQAGRGLTWFSSSVGIVKDNFLLWIGSVFLFVVCSMLLTLSPLAIFVNFVLFHFVAGFMIMCAKQQAGKQIRFEDMFMGLKEHFLPLLVLSAIYLFISLLIMIPIIVVLLFTGFGAVILALLQPTNTLSFTELMNSGSFIMMVVGILISFALFIPVIMSVYFAPALIVLHNQPVLKAMKMSFDGCLHNMLPFLILALVMLLIMPTVVVLTLGLGIFLVAPLFLITYYTSYRDIWTTSMING